MARTDLAAAIDTPRLRLAPMGVADAAAVVNGHRPDDAAWADGYPTEGTLVAAGLIVTARAEGQDLGPWTTYQMIRRHDGVVIGDCGYLGPPDEDGDVHVAYGVAEAHRNAGYASEALRALIAFAHTQPGVKRVCADADPTNLAPIRVMENAGMRRVGADDGLVYYAA